MKKKLLGLALVASLALSLASCSGAGVSHNEKIKSYSHEVTQMEYNEAIMKEGKRLDSLIDDEKMGISYYNVADNKKISYNEEREEVNELSFEYTLLADKATGSYEEIRRNERNGELVLEEHSLALANPDVAFENIYVDLINKTRSNGALDIASVLYRLFPIFVPQMLNGRLYYIDGNRYTIVEEYKAEDKFYKNVMQYTISKNSVRYVQSIEDTIKEGDKIISRDLKSGATLYKFGRVKLTAVDLASLKDASKN